MTRTITHATLSITALSAFVMAVSGCGKDEAGQGTPSAKAESAAGEEDESSAGGELDVGKLCAEVLPLDEVKKITGVDALAGGAKPSRIKPPKNFAECEYRADKSNPESPMVGAMLDCRSYSQNPKRQQQVYEHMDGYRVIDGLGRGAWGARTEIMKFVVHQVGFLSEVGCNVTVMTGGFEADHSEKLARLLYGKLTEDNAPVP